MLSLIVSTCAALVAPVVPTPPDSRPNPRDLELRWRAPEGCPTRDELERRIRALLPAEPTGDGLLVVDGDVTVGPGGATLVLRSTFDGRTEARTIEAPTCSELGESTAVLVAIALEPSATLPSEAGPAVPEPEVAPTEAEPPPPLPTTPPIDEPVDEGPTDDGPIDPDPIDAPFPERRPPPVGLGLRLAFGLEAGAMPPPSAALSAAVSILWPRARLEAHGLWLAPRTVRESDGRGGTYQLGTAGLRGCARFFVRNLELPLCAGAEGGAVRVRPRGIDDAPTIVRGGWAAAVVGFGLARAWGPVAIVAGVDGVARIVGNRFQVGEATSLRQFPVSMRALLGIELRLGDPRR